MISLFSRWVRPKLKANLTHWRVTVYSRAQCCCCHKALDLLRDYERRYKFAVDEVDIDTDPELVSLYNTIVPVVAINVKVRFKGGVDPALLDRLIVAETRG